MQIQNSFQGLKSQKYQLNVNKKNLFELLISSLQFCKTAHYLIK
ncbi:hypothetical protein ACIN8IBEIGE_200216 [Acinetobacter sp. 8I-beige]|nr:hypothetical protein ACIN8IBEIGE_200216 [Acinetobacter sp. 8I-beige]